MKRTVNLFFILLPAMYASTTLSAETGRLADVRAFGAAGDGKTNDTAVFQKAVDAAQGIVTISPGTYRLTEPVVVNLDKVGPLSISGTGSSKVVMAGPGPAFKIIGTHQGTANPATVKDNVWARQRMPVIEGIEIVGKHAEADGIQLEGTMQAVISRVLVRKARHAVHLTTRNRNVVIVSCHFYENSGAGIFIDDCNLHQINVGDCHISYNAGGGIVVRHGAVRNLQIGNCDIEGNMGEDGPATANVLIDMTDGSIGELAITGCTIQHTRNAPESANIRMIGANRPKGTLEFAAISNNLLSDADIHVELRHVRGATLTGNVFFGGADQHDLLVADSSKITLGANVFDRNYPQRSEKESPRGIVFSNCSDCSITGCQLTNVWHKPAGLILDGCRRFTISACSIADCDGAGLLMKDVHDSVIQGCVISDGRETSGEPVALTLESGSGNLIVNNIFKGAVNVAEGSAELTDNAVE